ncbi:hypothetical protein N665_0272s0014 [Sinapis alba]|nr:hypothetical protein N665_0272s0014 [Sinapis alba]
MSTSKFVIFCIVLFFFANCQECARFDRSKATCSKTPDNVWCCNMGQCRSTKALCDKICQKR